MNRWTQNPKANVTLLLGGSDSEEKKQCSTVQIGKTKLIITKTTFDLARIMRRICWSRSITYTHTHSNACPLESLLTLPSAADQSLHSV